MSNNALTLTVKPYALIAGLSEKERDAALLPTRAKIFQARLDLELCQLDEQLLTAERGVQELLAVKEPHLMSLLDAVDDHALLSRKKAQLEALVAQLFPAAVVESRDRAEQPTKIWAEVNPRPDQQD